MPGLTHVAIFGWGITLSGEVLNAACTDLQLMLAMRHVPCGSPHDLPHVLRTMFQSLIFTASLDAGIRDIKIIYLDGKTQGFVELFHALHSSL